MLSRITTWLLANPVQGLRTPPRLYPLRGWLAALPFATVSLLVGLTTGLFRWEPVMPGWGPFLAVSLFFSPALLEELVFRGLLLPRNLFQRGTRWTVLTIGASTLLYVLSHPLGALTTSAAARPWFLHPAFLIIVFLLGLTCAYSYLISKSLWNAVLIHWLAVVVWVFFLGGYDVVLALEGEVWATGTEREVPLKADQL